MNKPSMKLRKVSGLKAALVIGVMALSLAGCVVYPGGGYNGGYGYGYAPGYYAPPPVSFNFGYYGGYGGGYRHWH
jgi:hypothetical protein